MSRASLAACETDLRRKYERQPDNGNEPTAANRAEVQLQKNTEKQTQRFTATWQVADASRLCFFCRPHAWPRGR